jgi:hypothetical protein
MTMSAGITMEQRMAGASPRFTARMAGVMYLLSIVMGVVGVLFVGAQFMVNGDAAATATNIVAHETLFRLSFAFFLIGLACYVVVTALLYRLLQPVNQTLSLLAALFSLIGCCLWAVGSLFQLATLSVLGGGGSFRAFAVGQVQDLAFTILKLNSLALSIGMVFFGFYCLLIGYLVFRSTFLPRVVGVLMALAGLGYLTNLYPPLENALSTFLQVPGLLGEGSLTLWLLIVGVNVERWKEKARAVGIILSKS